MDSTVPAVLVGAVLAGAGGLLVPRAVARLPEIPAEPGSEADATVDAPSGEDPPEPFADIARLPGLAWKSGLVALLAGAVVGYGVGWTWALVVLVPLVPVAVALGVVDWRTRLLPNAIIHPTAVGLLVLVVAGALVTQDLAALERSVLAALVGSAFFFVAFWIYPRGLGFGDVRLAGVLGLALGWVGWGTFLVGIYAGFLLGGVVGGLLALARIVDRKGYPFGPFMLLGALAGVVWGADLWSSLVTG